MKTFAALALANFAVGNVLVGLACTLTVIGIGAAQVTVALLEAIDDDSGE